MTWTEQHTEFCFENQIPPAAIALWQWLMKKSHTGVEHEPDLKEFNEWVAKHRGKPYHRDTLKRAIAKLVEHRIVNILRTFTWRIYRLVVRPLSWLKPRKKARSHAAVRVSPPSNPQPTVEDVKQQQQSSLSSLPDAIETCTRAGIVFNPESFDKLLPYSADDLQMALALYAFRGGAEKIFNPSGWLLECLKGRWWLDQMAYGNAY